MGAEKCDVSAAPDVNRDVVSIPLKSMLGGKKKMYIKLVIGSSATYEYNIDTVTWKRKLSQQWMRFPTNPVISCRELSPHLTCTVKSVL